MLNCWLHVFFPAMLFPFFMHVGYFLECIPVTMSNTVFPIPLKTQFSVLVLMAVWRFAMLVSATSCPCVSGGTRVTRPSFSAWVKDKPTPLRHVELALSWWHRRHRHVPPAGTTHRIPEHFPLDTGSGCRNGVSPSRSWRAPDFYKTTRHVQNHQPVHVFGKQIQWVDRARYLGLTVDKQLMWSSHINQVGKWAARRLSMLAPFLMEADCLSKAVLWFISRSIVL
jgi:hypothetical protein